MACENCACGSQSTGTAVPLKRGPKAATASGDVWSLQAPSGSASARSASPSRPAEREEQLQEILGDVQPLAKKCGADEREGHQCCKDLKGEDERRLISPEIVRDV